MDGSSQSTDADVEHTSFPRIASPRSTTSTTASNTGTRTRTRKPQPATPSSSVADTFSGMRKAASETLLNLQEWAKSPKHGTGNNNSFLQSPVAATLLSPCAAATANAAEDEPAVQMRFFPDTPTVADGSPKHAVHALYGSASGTFETVGVFRSSRQEESADHPGANILHEFAKPFVSCTGGSAMPPLDLSKMKHAVGRVVHGDMSGARQAWGDAAAPAFSESNEFEDSRDYENDNDEISLPSMTSLDEEAMRVRRLTSWNTNGTLDTAGTMDTFGTATSVGASFVDTNTDTAVNPFDDDGNPIDPTLIKAVNQKKRQQQRRKRVVKFDYPPISSVRECPRHDVNDLEKLFFSEAEMDQIEADRAGTETADDVEVVAVSSSASMDGAVVQTSKYASAHPPSPAVGAFSSYVPTPRMWSKKKGQGNSYFGNAESPRRAAATRRRGLGPDNGVDATQPPPNKQDPRMVKRVQIYLRERSTAA